MLELLNVDDDDDDEMLSLRRLPFIRETLKLNFSQRERERESDDNRRIESQSVRKSLLNKLNSLRFTLMQYNKTKIAYK